MRRPFVCPLVLLALATGGCGTDPIHAPLLPVVAVELSGLPADGILARAYPRQLTALTLGPAGIELTDRAVQWRLSPSMIGTVTVDGLLETSAVGLATVSATAEGVKEAIPIEVRDGVEVPATGAPASATLLSGLVTLSVPSSAGAAGTVIHVRASTVVPTDDRFVAGTAVDVGPLALELAAPAQLGIAFDATGIPAPDRPSVRLFGLYAGPVWLQLPGGSVDLGEMRASADLSSLTTVAVFRRSVATQLLKVAGDNQTAARSAAVAISPVVQVLDAQGRPVEGITVTFIAGAGGGQVTGPPSTTSGLLGLAAVPGQWRLGASAGTYTLIASIPGGITATFTATALP